MPERLNINQIVRMPQATNFSSFRQHINNIRRMSQDFDSVSDMFAKDAISKARTAGDLGGKNAITFGEDGKPVRASAPQAGGAYVEAYQNSARQMHIGANQVHMRNKVLDIVTEYRGKPTDPKAETEFTNLISSITNNVPEDIKSATLIDLNAIVGQGRRTLKDEAARKAKIGANHEARVDINERLATVYDFVRSDAGFFYQKKWTPAANDPNEAQISAEGLISFRNAKDAIEAHYAAGHIHAEEHATSMGKLREYITLGTLKATVGLNQENLKVGNGLNFYAKLREFENSTDLYLGRFKLTPVQRQNVAKELRSEWTLRVGQLNAASRAYAQKQDSIWKQIKAEQNTISLQRPVTWQDTQNLIVKYNLDTSHSANQERISASALATSKDEDEQKINIVLFTLDDENSWENENQRRLPSVGAYGYENRHMTNFESVLTLARGNTDLVKKILDRYASWKKEHRKTEIAEFNRVLKQENKVADNKKTAIANAQKLMVSAAKDLVLHGIQAGTHDFESLDNIKRTALLKTVLQAGDIADRTDMDFASTIDLSRNTPEVAILEFMKTKTYKDGWDSMLEEYYKGGGGGIAYSGMEEYVIKNWTSITTALDTHKKRSYGQSTLKSVYRAIQMLEEGVRPHDSDDMNILINYYTSRTGVNGFFEINTGTAENPIIEKRSIWDITNPESMKFVGSFIHQHGSVPPIVYEKAEANGAFSSENVGKFREFMESLIKIGVADKFITFTQIKDSLTLTKLPDQIKNMISRGLMAVRDWTTADTGNEKEEQLINRNIKAWMAPFQEGYIPTSVDKDRSAAIADEVKNFKEIFDAWATANDAWVADTIFGVDHPYTEWAATQSWYGREFSHSPESINIMAKAYAFYRTTLDKEMALITAFKHVSTTMASGVDDFVVANPSDEPPVSKSVLAEIASIAGVNSKAAQTPFALGMLNITGTPIDGTGNNKYPKNFKTLYAKNPKNAQVLMATLALSQLEGLPGFKNQDILDRFHGPIHLIENRQMQLIPLTSISNVNRAEYSVRLWDRKNDEWVTLPPESNVVIDRDFVDRLDTYNTSLSKLTPEDKKLFKDIKNDSMLGDAKGITKQYRNIQRNEINKNLELSQRRIGFWHGVEDVLSSVGNAAKTIENFHEHMFTEKGKKFLGKKTKVSDRKFNINHAVNSSVFGGSVRPFIAHDKKEGFQSTIELLTELEDFRASKYPDGEHDAIGIGSNLGWLEPDELRYLQSVIQNGKITEPEAILLAKMRVNKIFESFYSDKRFSHIEWENISNARMSALAVTVYQVGMPEFKTWNNTIKALTRTRVDPSINWEKVAKAMETDKAGTGPALWTKQTPNRAKRVLNILRGL
jgi:hypothetical protein